jgi:hypothetical protein
MFMSSFFEIPRGFLQKLDYYRSFFFLASWRAQKEIPSFQVERSLHAKRIWWLRNT